jgi:hypothetical protein
MGFGLEWTTRSVRTSREPSDTVSGKSGSQLLLQWTEVRIVGLDGREEEVVSTSSTGYVGRLVAFVDMKVDELLNDDMPSRNQHWQQSKCLCSVQPEKSFNDGTREKADQVTVVQQNATRDMSPKCLAVSTRNKYHHSWHFYCCQGVRS